MLNSDFVRARARAFAKRVLATAKEVKKKPGTAALQFAFELANSRPPTAAELLAAKTFLREQETAYAGKSDATEQIWADFCQMLLASNAFLYVD